MNIYQEMRKLAMQDIEMSTKMNSTEAIMATLTVGIIYALLAIAAAISDLKP